MNKDKLAFYLSTGLSGMIIIPSLYIMVFAFVICTVVLIGYGIAALFMTLPVNVGFMVLTGVPAFITSVMTGGILLVLAFICRKSRRKYLNSVSMRYQELHPEQ